MNARIFDTISKGANQICVDRGLSPDAKFRIENEIKAIVTSEVEKRLQSSKTE